jgi:heme/copper-type cytochrome/quinol oxidase subunit 2
MHCAKRFSPAHKAGELYLKLGTFITLSVMSLKANASPPAGGLDAGGVGKNVGNQMSGLTEGALKTSAFVGIVLVIIGTMKWLGARQNQEEAPKEAIKMTAVGAVLLAIPIIITIVNMSFFGTDASSDMQNAIIEGV